MKDVFERVIEAAAGLPEAEESTHYGTPAFKVRKKMFVRLHELGNVLVVRCPIADRDVLTRAEPDKYFFTPHYAEYPAMLVRLDAVSRKELCAVVRGAYGCVAPRALVDAMDGARDSMRDSDRQGLTGVEG